MPSKAACERIHVKRRAMQRFGKSLSNDTLRGFARSIRSGAAVFLWRTSNNRTNWAVWHDGQWYPVVYSRITKQVLTVLPATVLDKHWETLDRLRSRV